MENHLHLTRDSLDLVCRRLTVEFSNLHLDQELCKSLARDFLVPVQRLLASYADHMSTEMLNEAFQYHHHMFQELYRVAHRAHILVERCCEEKWWRILFTQACTSHREEALDIVDDLRWCIAEIEKDSHFPKQPTPGREHFRTLFKGCEQLDRCVLLNKLETLVSNLEKRGLYAQSDLQLAKFLLARMKAIPGDQIEASLDYQKFNTKGENGRPLGKGSAGSVFKTDFLSIQCARKEQEACSDVELQDFAKQAVKLSKLSHPHVIKLFGFYGNKRLDEAHRGFFLMELMSGSLYKEMMRCGTKQLFQLRVAVDIMIQMAKGVRYLHENGISHRDLKCDNILVTRLLIPSELASTSYEEYQHIKVTDFDMAKFFTGTSSDWELQSRANVGTTPWRAPECYTERGKGSVVKVNAKRADSYSFAMTCFELLSVENSPFDALPVDGMAEKKKVAIQAGIRPPIPEACPLLLKRLIADCWQNEAPQRPDFDEIHRRLQDVQSVVLTDTLCQRNRQCDGASASLQRRGVSMISTMFKRITCNAANVANKLLKVISPQMHSGITEVVPPSSKEDATLSVTKVVVGLDFGTTHSGVAYATASNPHDIHTISWPSVEEEVYSCKTLTAIYRPAPNGAWVWGYEARKEYASRYGREGDQYFKELKQSLSSLGNELQPVVEYLRKLGEFVLRYLRLYAEEESLRMEHLRWCITVPSDWSSDSRQFRSFSACLEMAGLVPGQAFHMFRESDAAAQHCYMNCFSSALHLERGDGVCVLDIGSGNLQCVFEDWHDVERTQFAYGATLSSAESLIKEEFFRFICEKVGQVSDVDPSFHDADLEYLKAYPNHSISMPCLKSSLASTNISLKLSSSEWAVVLKPLVDEVVSFLQEQLRKNSSVNLKRLFVVGGYGKNAHLIEEIERSFPAVIVDKSLRNPGSAICKGAVALGMMPLQARTLHSGSSSNTEGGGEETNLDGGTRGADSNQHGQPGSSQPASSQKLNPSSSTYYSSAADSKGKKKSNAKDDLEDVLQEKVLVALDFGTSQMSFAYSNASHPSEIAVCEDHQRRTMAFYYEIQGNILCLRSSGQMAKVDCEANIPGEYVSEPKLHVLVDDHDPELELNLPTGLTIDDVISDSLREYGEFILQVLQEKFGESFELQHIQWCLLVPSFWGENVKRGMRNCMVNAGLLRGARNVDASPYPLVTVLEAEAASVACIRSLNLSKGMKFMVASIGAGALDMVIHEMIGEADLREVSMSAGGFYGSLCLDLNFLTFLSMRMGAWISNYLKRNPCVLNNLLSQWEQIKVNFFDDCDPSTLVFPKALQDAWRHSKPTSTSAQLESLQLTSEDVKMIFEPVVRTILERMAAQLDQTSTVDALVLVGKFAKSPCLYGHIKHRFCDQVKTVIRLDDSESVVLEGAILFGMQQTIIRSRVAKRTYGLGMSLDFQVGLCSTDEVERFRIDVEKGSHVEVNSCVTSVHKLRSHVQRNMKFTLYSSVDSYPRYTEEESVTKEWDFMVDTLDEEPQVEIILYYGRSAIEIEAKGVKGNLLPVTFVTEAMSQRNVVAPRVARRTYGIGVLNTREKWDLLKYVKHIDGEDLCDFCFEPYIRRGTQLDYFASRTVFPVRNKQQYLPFRLYSSSETSPVYVTDDAVVEEGMLEIDIRNGLIMDKDREVSVRMWFSRTDIKIRAVALNFAQPEDRKLPIRLSDGEWESQVTLNLTRHLRVVPLPSGALGRLQADSCITSGKMDEECCMKDGTASGTSQDDDIKLKKKGPPVVSSEPTPNAAGASEGQFMSMADLETVQVIGKGAEGVVQLFRHRWTHKTYALKVMEMNIHETVRKQIVEEIKFNQIFQWQFYNNGVISIVLEHMDGGSLSDILKLQKMIPEPYLAIISKQVLKGLRYLHQVRHIIHRDIKPSNVLINHKGEVKISDFGVSAVLATSMGQRGIYTYMSPERISGGNYAYDSDMWSLGLTLLECALGRFPYQPHGQEGGWLNFYELLECIVEQPPPALPTDKFTPEFCSFIAACIQKCPDKRPSAADLLMHPFLKKYSKEEYHLSELFPPLEHPHQSANLAKGVWSPQGNAVKLGVQGHDYESRPGDSSQLANVELARSQITKGEVKLEVKSGQIEPTLSGDSLGKKGLGYYDLTIAGRMLQDYINDLITSNASPDEKVKMKIQEYNDLRDELEAKKWYSGDSSSSNERLLITPQQRIKLISMLHDYQSVLEPENQAEDQTESQSQDLESELRFQDESSEVPLYISDSDFSHGNVYTVTLTAALDACEKHVHEFNSVLPSVVIFTRLCKYMVGTVSPVAVAKFQRYRIVLDLLHRMDPEDAPIPRNLRNSISFCFESLVGLARRFQLVEELLRKCSSPEWHISALELANVRPRKHVTRWSEFSLSVRDCEWSLDIVELAFHALDMLLMQRQYTVKDTSFKWSSAKGRMVLQIPGKLDRLNTADDSLTQMSKEWCVMEEEDRLELVEKLEGLVKYERERKHPNMIFRRSTNAKKIASFLSEKLQGPTPEVGTYFPYSFSELNHPANLIYLEYLDKGSSGMVTIHDWFGVKVAVKSVRAIGLNRAHFEQEAAVLAMSQHPNVVRLINCWFLQKMSSSSGTGQLVMELMDHDLRSIIESRLIVLPKGSSPFSPMVAIDLMLQIAQAMLYLYDNRILHRDLKTKNVLVNICKPLKLTSRGSDTANTSLMGMPSVSAVLPHTQENYVAKLADFGLARCRPASSYVTTAMAGTAGWRAPEIFHVPDSELAIENVYKWPADVYSFGMTAYEIVTGKLPFEDEPNHSLHGKIMAGERPPFANQDFPEAVKELIQECWATDPNDRPNFKDIVKRLWECKVLAILPGFERNIMQTASAPASGRLFH